MGMKLWQFRDFKSDRGENAIHSWLHDEADAARADINDLIAVLEVLNKDAFSREDNTGQLHDRMGQNCVGLIELRVKVKGVQYRPIGFYGPGRKVVTLLAGATERDRKLNPTNICDTAKQRKDLVELNQEMY